MPDFSTPELQQHVIILFIHKYSKTFLIVST